MLWTQTAPPADHVPEIRRDRQPLRCAPPNNAASSASMTTSASPTATDWHRRQRAMVAASLIAVPGIKSPTHRGWA
jgi:hypothetical protein